MKIVNDPDIPILEIFDDDSINIIDYNSPLIDPLFITSKISDSLYNNDPNKEDIFNINLKYLDDKIKSYQYIIYPKTLKGLYSKIYNYRKEYGVPVVYGETCKLNTIYSSKEYYKINKYKELINEKYEEWFNSIINESTLYYPFTLEL